jgi:putative ABC transport system permease protein
MVLTVSVVVMFVSVMTGIVHFVHDSGTANGKLTRIIILPRLGGGGVPESLLANIHAVDGIQVVQRFKVVGGRLPNGIAYFVVGEEATGLELNTEFFPVEPAVNEAWKKERLGAVVSEQTAKDLGLKVGDESEVSTSGGPLRIKVVGLSHNPLVGQRIAVHYDYLREFLKSSTCWFRAFSKPEDSARVSTAIEEQTKNSAAPLQAVDGAQFAAALVRDVGMVPAILGFLGAFLILVTVLTLANNCSISVRERRTETATLRVLGYHRGTIARLVVSEAMLIGLIGGVLAIAICAIAFRDGVQLTPGQAGLLPPVTVVVPGVVVGLIVALVVPLLGALPAAWTSLRTPLVQALRDTA